MSKGDGSTAIVIGAGMAGLVTARVLSDHVGSVRIMERDRLPERTATRRGVPQGRHAHVLLGVGQQLLEGWFPGLSDELVARGAVPVDAGDIVIHQAGDHRIRADLGFVAMSMSRPLLEGTVRDRLLLQHRNVTVTDEISVDGPVVEDGRVVGVRVDGDEHLADLVVDCSGRNTRFLDLLTVEGFPTPDVSAIRVQMAYGSRVVRRRSDDLDGSLALVIDLPERGHRMGVMVPIEDDRWLVTLGSCHGEVPPTESPEYEAFARSLPSSELADLLARDEDDAPVMAHRMPTSQRRHVERLDRVPPGFLVLGDAICSINPVYGQGMSSAAMQARALGDAIERHGLTSPRLARDFYRRAARVVDVPWRIAAGADFADPRTTGHKPLGTDLSRWYLEKVFRACHTSLSVARQMMRVQNLLARPGSLMSPAMVLRVMLAARRSPPTLRPAAGRRSPVPARHPDATDLGAVEVASGGCAP